MIKYTALFMIFALRIVFNPAHENKAIAPFYGQQIHSSNNISVIPANFIQVDGKISADKVWLTWNISENETADMFEVEKSKDGKHFSLAALVFSTDKMNNDEYQFYEKAGNSKVSYRIKLINKNREAFYSKIIEIKPGV